jgi:hypothetical protein
MKCTLLLAAWMAGLALSASVFGAMPLSNVEQNGQPVLVPEVRHYTPRPETVTIPDRLTVYAPEPARLEIQQLTEDLERFETIELLRVSSPRRAFLRMEITQRRTPDHDQGYSLVINRRGIQTS